MFHIHETILICEIYIVHRHSLQLRFANLLNHGKKSFETFPNAEFDEAWNRQCRAVMKAHQYLSVGRFNYNLMRNTLVEKMM